MSEFSGMDVDQVQSLAKRLAERADTIDAMGRLDGAALSRLDANGPRIEQFRQDWQTRYAPALRRAAVSLREAGRTLERNAGQQGDASQARSDTVDQALRTLLEGAAEGVKAGNAEPYLGIGQPFVLGDKAMDRLTDLWRQVDFDTARHTTTGLLDRLIPTPTEIIAETALVLGREHLPGSFDDGEPFARPEREIDGVPAPENLSDVVSGVNDAYAETGGHDGAVKVTTVQTPSGPRYIVHIQGTVPWGPRTGDTPMDLTGNLVEAAGGASTATKATRMAIEQALGKAGVPENAQVMLSGHSQGGMIAAHLASDPAFVDKYNVTNVLTVGAPIDNYNVDPSVRVMDVQHASPGEEILGTPPGMGDVVPRLDLGLGSDMLNPNHGHYEVRNLDPTSSAPFVGLGADHSIDNYARSLSANNLPPDLKAEQARLAREGFLGGPGDKATSRYYQAGRR